MSHIARSILYDISEGDMKTKVKDGSSKNGSILNMFAAQTNKQKRVIVSNHVFNQSKEGFFFTVMLFIAGLRGIWAG